MTSVNHHRRPTVLTTAEPRTRVILSALIWRELAEQFTSARFLIVVALVLGVTPLVTYVGTNSYIHRLSNYNRLAAERQEIVAGPASEKMYGFDNPFTPKNELAVLRAIRPPEPFSALISGLDGVLPQYWDFSPLGVRIGPPAVRAERLADILGQLDLEFLIRVVLGLLAMLLAFDTVAGEKELGTLRLVLSHPVSRIVFLMGKLIAGAITLFTALGVLFLLALASATAYGLDLMGSHEITKYLIVGFTSGVYLLCLYALGVLISALNKSQKTALIIVLVIWVAYVLFLPPSASLVARSVSPMPLLGVVEAQREMLDRDLRRSTEVAMGEVFSEVTKLDNTRGFTSRYLKHKEEINARIAPILADYLNRRRHVIGELEQDMQRRSRRQQEWARVLFALSPAATFSGAATELVGSGDVSALAWQLAIRRYQSELDTTLFENPPMFMIRVGGASFWADLREPPPLSDLPTFSPPPMEPTRTLQRSLLGLAVLIGYTGLFITLAFWAFSRYDVR